MQKCDVRLDLEFRDLTYVIKDNKGKEKQILHGINGRFQSGRLTAVLGSSGAGKTSLLNVLSGFKTRGVCGSITINGNMWKPEDIRKSSCYITQEFSMLPNLTTRETLLIAAQLKLGSEQNCETVVDQILELLSLQKTVNTYVKNISGGEKKRLSIGVELVTNPPIMFLDEPTSGLDSLSSVQMISHLKSLAEGGRNIICVIHQPSSRLFQMFEDTLVVSEGQCIYNGQIDAMVQVFESSGFLYPIYYNLADFALEVACRERGTCIQELIEYSKKKVLSMKPIKDCSQFYLNEDLIDEKYTMIDNNSKSTDEHVQSYRKWNYCTQFPISRLEQFSILLKRSLLGAIRDTHLAYIRFITHIMVGLLLGILYFQIGNDASKVESNTACLFFFIMFLFFSNAVPTVHAFPLEASVFMREHLNNWYCLTSYYFAKLLSDIPLQLLCPLSFVLIAYFMTGQPSETERCLMFLFVCLLITMIAQTFGLATGAAFNMQLGTFIVAAATIPMFLFSGFFLRLKDIPQYLYPISYLSIFRFSFEAMMLSIYSERSVLQCNEIYCHFRYPEKLLKNMDMENASYWCDIGVMIGFLLIFQVILYLVLILRLRNAL